MKNSHSARPEIRPKSIEPYPLDPSELLDANKVEWDFDIQHGAVLVHDMQRFWVAPFVDRTFVARVSSLVAAARERGVPVIYTGARVAIGDIDRGVAGELFGPGIGRTHDAAPGDTEIIDDLATQPGDLVIGKPRYSAFYDTGLEDELRSRSVQDLAICGVYAHHGCMVTAIDAYMRGFRVHFVADAMGDHDLTSHEQAAVYVAETSGVITWTSDLVDQIRSARTN